jgi:CRP-like cAMP-binding protein
MSANAWECRMQNLSTINPVRKTSTVAMTATRMFQSADFAGATLSFVPNEEIYGEGEEATYIYKVVRGGAREFRILADGRRQILAFYFPGDVFAVVAGATHDTSAEALGSTDVLLVKRATVLQATEVNVALARELWSITAQALQRSQEHALLLIKSARERVASFLLEMSERTMKADALDLPMSRQEIADYLGLTIETVSRTLTQLKCSAAIKLIASRRIAVSDPKSLHELNA